MRTACRFALVALLAGWPWLSAFGQPATRSVPRVARGERLTAQGYTAIPLAPRDAVDVRFVVPAIVGKERLQFLLDTGAGSSLLTDASAKRAGLKRIDKPPTTMRFLTGEYPVHARSLTDFGIGGHRVPDGEILVGDLTSQLAGTQAVDGLLGQLILASCGAVIDYGKPALYLCDPFRREWPRLRGEWKCVRGERDGVKLADPRKWSVTITEAEPGKSGDGSEKAVIRHADRSGPAEVWFQYLQEPGRRLFAAISQSETEDLPLFEQLTAAGLCQVEGDILTLCYTLPERGAKRKLSPGLPTAFDSSAGSGYGCLKFERVGKGPAVLEPLFSSLACEGYSELRLARVSEHDNLFVTVLTVGNERLRMVVDTGSLSTVLDGKTAKRLGLPTRTDGRLTGQKPSPPLASLSGLQSGKVEFPPVNVHVCDLSKVSAEKDADRIDGLLGHDLLAHLSAVIDYDKPALYVISPTVKEWPRLTGEWACTAGTRDGKPLADTEHWRFHFGDTGKARITYGPERTDAAVGIDLRHDAGQRLAVITRDPSAKDARLFFGRGPLWVRYTAEGNTLRLAYLDAPKMTGTFADQVPMAVESKAGSGVVVLEFTRRPPEKK